MDEPSTSTHVRRRIAVILGFSEYKSPQIDDLPGCTNDIERMHELLETAGFDDILVIQDSSKTTGDIKAELAA